MRKYRKNTAKMKEFVIINHEFVPKILHWRIHTWVPLSSNSNVIKFVEKRFIEKFPHNRRSQDVCDVMIVIT